MISKMISSQCSEKLRELLPTLKHKKVKSILKQSLDGWQKTGIVKGTYGLKDISDNDDYFERNKCTFRIGCCLMGSALLGKKIHRRNRREIIDYNLWIYHGLSQKEQKIIELVFDGYEYWVKCDPRLMECKDAKLLIDEVEKIRKIVFGEIV